MTRDIGICVDCLRNNRLFFLRPYSILRILMFALMFFGMGLRASSGNDLFQTLIPAPDNPNASGGLVYADPHGHVIMEYDLARADNDKIYFYDGHLVFNLTADQSYALANTPGLLETFAKKHDLTPTRVMFGRTKFGLNSLEVKVIDAPQCQWPYNIKFDVISDHGPTSELMFFRRRESPKTDIYRLWCDRGPGEVEITTQFENLPLTILADSHENPLIAFRRPPVVLRFNSDGTRIDLRGTGGIFAVSARPLELMLTRVAEGELRPQNAIEILEKDLAIANAKPK